MHPALLTMSSYGWPHRQPDAGLLCSSLSISIFGCKQSLNIEKQRFMEWWGQNRGTVLYLIFKDEATENQEKAEELYNSF